MNLETVGVFCVGGGNLEFYQGGQEMFYFPDSHDAADQGAGGKHRVLLLSGISIMWS